MGFAAAHTTTLRLIPNVVVLPYRNPFVVAKAGATLDLLSGGRFTLAVGVGYLKREFARSRSRLRRARRLWSRRRCRSSAPSGPPTTSSSRADTSPPAGSPPTHGRSRQPHPPIWIGGNTAAARRRVAEFGDGWCPFPAPAVLAQTARTAAMETLDDLKAGIDDLQRRCDAAGRDPSALDVTFSNAAGGSPADDDFDADAFLDGVEKLAALGVTWIQVQVPGDSLAHAVEAIERFGKLVIAAS